MLQRWEKEDMTDGPYNNIAFVYYPHVFKRK